MASKVQVAKFPTLDNYNNNVDRWNMEEDDVAGQLEDDSFKKRVEVLEQLIITVKRNGGRLPYADGESIFRSLGLALSDSNWEIRCKCIQLLQEIIPNLGEETDSYMSIVLNRLIANIGDSKVTVRGKVITALRLYMKHTSNLSNVFEALVFTGLENENPAIRREMINSLPLLLTPEFIAQDLTKIINSLAKKLLDTSPEDNLRDSSLFILKKIESTIGEQNFLVYLSKLSVPLQKYYLQLSGKHDDKSNYNDSDNDYHHKSMYPGVLSIRNDSRKGYNEDTLEYGIVPSHILSRINDQKDFRTRSQAVEELKSIITGTNEISNNLLPHMTPFINFLSNLLDDSNFKIINVTLEIILCLVEKLDKNTSSFLKPLTSALLKRMGDNKIVVRQLVMSIVIKLMRTAHPQSVIDVLEDNLRHRNSRVRQETINFIIAALLTFPSYEFKLADICQAVGPTLTDVKRAVRQAALECFATLAQGMGQGQLQPLVLAVDQVELSTDGEGLMAAVQARLARKQLPKLTSDGLVEYATQTPSSATVRSSSAQQSADTEWIMAVSSTARSARSDSVDLESANTSARSTPDVSSPTSAPRRFLSAGRGRNKLPWEEDRDERSGPGNNFHGASTTQSFTVDDAPPQPRETWVGEPQQKSAVSERAVPKRRTTVMALTSPETDQDTGSYTQLYQQKVKRHQVVTSVRRVDDIKENGFTNNRQDQKHFNTRSFLDPISVDGDDSDFVVNSNSFKTGQDEFPVPRKAAMARGSATRRKVPPISTSPEFDDSDSAYAASDESRSGINGSLKTIRNSATKKRADKLFEKLEKQNTLKNQGSSSGGHSEESDGPVNDQKKSVKKLETKSNHVAINRGKKVNDATDSDESPGKVTIKHIEYNPISGVTFRENRNSDVQIVGKGYVDDSSTVAPAAATAKLKEKRRLNNRGSLSSYSSGGQPSMHLPGSVVQDIDDLSFPGGKGITLVGKGMFDTSNNLDHGPAVAQSHDDRLERRKIDVKTVPVGVVGVAMRSTVDLSSYSSETSGVDEDWEDENNLSLTQSLKEKVALRQQQKLEEDERRRAERERKEREKEERKEREKEEKLRKERERQQEKLKRLSSAESIHSLYESLSISGSGSGSGTSINRPGSPIELSINTSPVSSAKPPPKPQAPAVTTRKTLKTSNEPVSTYPMPVNSAYTPQNGENPEDLKPFKDSEAALRDLMKKLEQEDWETKCDGISMLRRLCIHHPDTIFSSLHPIILAICNEVKNLRSQVSRLAIVAVGEMFQALKRGMDPEADITCKTLLAKGGESNQFIREDVDKALCCLVDSITPQRALLALILGGASHKNPQIRKTTAQFIVELVEKMGSGKILSGVKDITDRVLPTAANFAMDGSPETRYHGRKILQMLMTHPDFDKMLAKHLPTNTLRSIQDIIDNLKQRGLGEMPGELSSARSRKSGHGSRSNSSVRGGSASGSVDSGVVVQPQRRPLVRTDEARMEEVKSMIGLMAANNWQQRYEGISNFQTMCENYPQVVSSQIIKIFDKFLPRLTDSNSKVNLYALKVMLYVIPLIKDSMGSVISLTVSSVAPNLSSKNKEIYSTAADIMDSLIENLDLTMLVQPFANQAINATSKSKADMVDKVSYLVEKVYPRKQQPIVLHVLPLIWHLLGSMNSSGAAVHGGNVELRHATGTLVNKLYECMGQALLDKASAEPSNTQRQIQMLQSLIDSS